MTGRKTILIVDDNERLCKQFESVFKRNEYDVIVAYSGEDALKVLAERSVDFIILDIILPGIDGYEVLKRIRLDMKKTDIPIILFTAHKEMEELMEIEKETALANACFLKPINPKTMLSKVRELLSE